MEAYKQSTSLKQIILVARYFTCESIIPLIKWFFILASMYHVDLSYVASLCREEKNDKFKINMSFY